MASWESLVGTSSELWSSSLKGWGAGGRPPKDRTDGARAAPGAGAGAAAAGYAAELPAATAPASAAPASGVRGGIVEHGLENEGGSNHCFLNVAIQAFWNLSSFRQRFLDAPEHRHDLLETVAQPGPGAAPGGPPRSAPAASSSGGTGGSPGAAASGREKSAATPKAGPLDSAESCCYCALKSVFTQYQYSEADTLPPDALRQTMAHTYNTSGRFQLGEMEDATETIEALLNILHLSHMYAPKDPLAFASHCHPCEAGGAASPSTAPVGSQGPSFDAPPTMRRRLSQVSGADRVEEASNFACQPPCIAHEVFGIEYVDLPRCTFCAATGEPTVVSSFLYGVYVAELLAEQGRSADVVAGEATVSDQFNRLTARLTGSRPDLADAMRTLCQRSVDKKCTECNSRHTVVSERWLTRRPHTFMVSLVWPTSQPSRELLWTVLSSIQQQIHMEYIFKTERSARSKPGNGEERSQQVKDSSWDSYSFRGLICYYGMHYVAFFYCWARKKWVLFDDTRVREESDWSGVVSVLMSGLYVPTVLFYENEKSASGVSVQAVEELARQVRDLEDRQSPCVAM